MDKYQQKRLLIQAAEELKNMIDLNNDQIRKGVESTDSDEPEYYDYQTCYELMVMAHGIN